MARTRVIVKEEVCDCGVGNNAISLEQCDQIERFLKVLGNKFAYESSPKDWGLWGYFKNDNFM